MTYLSVLNDKRLKNVVAEIRFRGHAFATIHRFCVFVQPSPIGFDAAGTDRLRVVLACGIVYEHAKELLDRFIKALFLAILPAVPPSPVDGGTLPKFLWPSKSSSGHPPPPPLSFSLKEPWKMAHISYILFRFIGG